ncbi:MAG: amino acid adenylation domain-containing protein [Oscillospiraceae bacterium]
MNSAIMMFEKTARRFPEKIAAQDEYGEISFSRLRRNALSVGSGLLSRERGLRPVIVYLPKSIAALTCFLGAQYSGNPYVPVDAAIPLPRLQSIIASMGAGHIITSPELAAKLADIELGEVKLHLFDALLALDPQEDACLRSVADVIDADPIYIMFTSGSTGVPKGVTIPHRGIIDYAEWLEETFAFDENTVLGSQSAFYFDNSTLDIYTMFRTGAKLVMIPEVLFRFPTKLPDFLRENHINAIFWVPTVMIAVANSGALEGCLLPELQKVLFCGEAMPNRQLNIWRKAFPDLLYANLYGPTEITDVCTYYIIDRPFADTDPLPIGYACRNMRAIILRGDGSEAETGESGELCIEGSALARGYWNAPEITRKAFIQNPLRRAYDDRLYRTGDLALKNDEGSLIFLGRADSQIKLRGNRIELGEIETAAKSLPYIKNAAALFDAEKQEIVLFAETEETLIPRKLNLELKKLIPSYMLPARLVCMTELPQTPNGKIDRVRLKQTF